MKRVLFALVLTSSIAIAAYAEEPSTEKIDLKDGSTLFLRPDGTSRMVDAHGKRMTMSDGVEMETADGQTMLMMNKKVWVKYGPRGKGRRHLKTD